MNTKDIVSVNRSELKYEMHPLVALELQNELDILLQRDAYSAQSSYMVRSLYFDSVNDIDFSDKYAGVEKRKKIRIRVYSSDAVSGKIELKRKEGNYSYKKSLNISRNEIIMAQKGDYSFLLDYESHTAWELYTLLNLGCYRPKAIIEYQRIAFVYPENHIRITLDSQIKSSEGILDLMADNLTYIPVIDDRVILEVKYDGTLIKVVSDILKKYKLTQVSVSKYASGRSIYAKYIL